MIADYTERIVLFHVSDAPLITSVHTLDWFCFVSHFLTFTHEVLRRVDSAKH